VKNILALTRIAKLEHPAMAGRFKGLINIVTAQVFRLKAEG
jgi:hypothetical protein